MAKLDEIQFSELDIVEIKRSLLKESFFDFVNYFWNDVITEPLIYNWHIEYLCDELQKVGEWVIKGIEKEYDLIINIAPGTSKSTLVSRMFPVWLWVNSPIIVILSNTIDDNNAKEFARASKDLITTESFQELFPEIVIRQDVNSVNFYENTEGGRRYSFTTKGRNKTGKHADILLDDDPMDFISAQSESDAKGCINGFKALQTRKKDKKKAPYILVMQRLSHRDTTAHALEVLPKVKHICLPADNKHNNVQPTELNDKYIDGLLDPVRLSKEVLEAERRGLVKKGSPLADVDFETQYNQEGTDESGVLYDIHFYYPSKINIPSYQKIKMSALDPADKGEDSLAYSEGFLWDTTFYHEDVVYNDYGIETNKITIEARNQLYMPTVSIVETNGMGAIVYALFNLINKLGVNESTSKKTKIKAFAWIISNYFRFNGENKSPEYLAFIEHVRKFPKNCESSHDDPEDSLTLIAKYLFINYQYLFQNAA